MKRLLLLLPLLCLGADTPQEIEGWKIREGQWQVQKRTITGQGWIVRSHQNDELTLSARLTVTRSPDVQDMILVAISVAAMSDGNPPRYTVLFGGHALSALQVVAEGDSKTVLARSQLPAPVDNLRKVAFAIQRKRGFLSVRVGNAKPITIKATEFSGENIGIRTTGCTITLSNMVLKD